MRKRGSFTAMASHKGLMVAAAVAGLGGAFALVATTVQCGGDAAARPPATPGMETTRATATDAPAAVAARATPAGNAASTAGRIRARLASCAQISKGLYKTDDETSISPTVAVCELGADAVYWTADMDIDCDGIVTPRCNKRTDQAFQPGTAAESSTGTALKADELPYVVVPSVSSRFNFEKAGIELGTVVMVISGDKIEYGIIGDTGPEAIIGEASYAMAKSLGIDPDPSTGGTDGPVLYIAFKGKAAVVRKNEDHAEAVAIGKARAAAIFSAP